MLVATHYESVDSIETKIQDYVNEQLNIASNKDDIVLFEDYSLEDSRLELSSSVKSVCIDSKNALLGIAEVKLSDCTLPERKQSILDILPLELRQAFSYENEVTDEARTLLLRKDLTIVSLIQNLQDELNGVNVDETEIDEETVETDFSEEQDFSTEQTSDNLITEIQDISLTDLEEEPETSIDLSVSDLDEFSLEEDSDTKQDNDTVEEFDITELDTFDLEDEQESDNVDTTSVEEFDVSDLDTFEIDTEEDIETDIEDDTEEDIEDDTEEDLADDIEDDTEEDLAEDIENDTEEDIEKQSSAIDENIETETSSTPQVLSDVELFKSIMTKDTEPRQTPVFPTKTFVDENTDLGLEDLESVSEDEIETTTDLDTDFDDDLVDDTEEEFTNEELDDIANEDLFEDEDDEEDLSDEEDTDILEDNEEDEDEDIEFEEDEEQEDVAVISEIDKDGDGVNDTYAVDKDGDGVPDLFIDKSDDNVEFLDTSNVSMSKPNIETPKVVPKSELGRILKDKANSDKGVHEKRTFLQEFDKDAEQVSDKGQSIRDFKDSMSRTDTKPVARAPAKPEPEQLTELPPLRTYLKKHPYTLIEDLLKMGYSNAEIQDGVKRGKFVKKNGMLRALF